MTHYRISIPITKQSYQIDKMVERAYVMSSNQWHTFFALYTHIQFRLRSFSISIAVDRAFVALFCFLIYERQTSYNFQPSKSYLLNFEKLCEKIYMYEMQTIEGIKIALRLRWTCCGLDFGSFSFRKTIMDRMLVIHKHIKGLSTIHEREGLSQ